MRAPYLLAGGISLLAAACGSPDPPLAVAQNVDLSRFQGQWHEIAKLPRVTQTDCYGTSAAYTVASDGSIEMTSQCSVGSFAGPTKTVTMHAIATDPSTPAKLSLQVGGFTGDYWILEVGGSYEYAVIGHPSRTYFWILSRTTQMDAGTLQGVLARARAAGFDTTRLEYTPQLDGPATPQGNVPPPEHTGCAAAPAEPGWPAASFVALGLAAATSVRRKSRR